MPSESDSLPAVEVRDVSIEYRTNVEKVPTLKTRLRSLGRRSRQVRHVRAVNGVSFDVPRGQVLGIVGGNGAGKSTMLRAMAGILPPSTGQIVVRGETRLLALGLGFNKKLSGRENVLLGGLASGLSPSQIDNKFEEIVDLADVGDFIDFPVNTYSSGMFSRLAFAVAVNMDPDILLIDEALSAGDAAFKERATQKMEELRERASTIVLVSHALGSINEIAGECIWMHQGKVMARGEPTDVTSEYTQFAKVKKQRSAAVLEDL